jgi:hypothetical protein
MDHAQIIIKPLTSNDAGAFKALRLKAILDSPAALWPTYEEEAGSLRKPSLTGFATTNIRSYSACLTTTR